MILFITILFIYINVKFLEVLGRCKFIFDSLAEEEERSEENGEEVYEYAEGEYSEYTEEEL